LMAVIFSLIAISCPQSEKKSGSILVETAAEMVRLNRTNPETEKIPSQAILNFLKGCNEKNLELHSMMLLKNGNVVFERWWAPYAPQYRHELYSLSKSFTSIAVGMAADEGLLTVDTMLGDIFTEEFAQYGSKIDDRVKRMTVKNLLTMSTGMENEYWNWREDPDGNNIISFLCGAIADDPGQTFRYSTLATYMLSAAVTRITGKTLVEYLDPRLFIPMGIDRYWTLDDKTGVNMGGFGLAVTTEDIAKFGQLILQKGMWEGKQLVSENWIEEATKRQISNGEGDGDWAMGYGYQFWQCKPDGVFRGDGASGQYCVVIPSESIVIAITANVMYMDQVLDLLWEMLDDIKSLPVNRKGARELASYANLSHLGSDKDAEEYPRFFAEYVMDHEEDNSFYFNSISFDFMAHNECVMSFHSGKIGSPHSTFLFLNGQWLRTSAPNYWTEKLNRTVTNGVWKENTFTATTWYYETALRMEYRFTFNDDFTEVTVEQRRQTYSPFEHKGKAKRIELSSK